MATSLWTRGEWVQGHHKLRDESGKSKANLGYVKFCTRASKVIARTVAPRSLPFDPHGHISFPLKRSSEETVGVKTATVDGRNKGEDLSA